ncbi:MAG TPA: MerR family transcriptional regulator [Polyangia bacterium]
MKTPKLALGLTVSQVARAAGVSVRALHHYDEIGLLRPSARSDAGYRLYDQRDLERLQQIMFFRALELPLDEVAKIMNAPAFDVRATLLGQRELLINRLAHCHALIDAVDAAIARLAPQDSDRKGDTTMTKAPETNELEKQGETLFSAFKDFKPEDYEAEAEQRWGHTDAYKESKIRTARYREEDWKVIKAESGATLLRLADELAKGTPPDAPAAMDAAEAHRQHIERWFYTCPPSMHRGLGQLYVNDTRFTANIDKIRPGLSAYAEKAFAANAARQGG